MNDEAMVAGSLTRGFSHLSVGGEQFTQVGSGA